MMQIFFGNPFHTQTVTQAQDPSFKWEDMISSTHLHKEKCTNLHKEKLVKLNSKIKSGCNIQSYTIEERWWCDLIK